MRRFVPQRLARNRLEGRGAPLALVLAALVCGIWLPTCVLAAAESRTDTGSPPLELTERQAEAEAVRELRFKKAPVYKPLKRAQIAPFLERELFDRYDEGELENLLAAYEKLGLIKSADGLVPLLVEAYAGQVIAFYDEKTRTVHLIDDLPVPPLVQRIAELHELVHALQDQHFNLSALPIKEAHSTDRANAAMALVEGDATLATVEYAAEYAQRPSVGDVLRIASWALQPGPTVPYLFRREAHFVYFDGLKLARVLYANGGWETLNRAFAHPPASTEQVLHPRQKFLDERDEPTPVELPDCAAALGAGWKLVAEDTLGELYTQVLFRQHLSFARAGKPSRGWDGDRLHFYRSGDGRGDGSALARRSALVQRSALVWRSVWDTEKDADEFGAAYRKLLERKLRPSAEAASRDEHGADDTLGLVVSGERGSAIVRVEGTEALVVEAPTPRMARAVVRHILAAARHKEEQTADEELNSQ